MKNLLKCLFAFFLSISLVSLFSCNDIIFSDIRDEIELDDATISGAVLSIVRYKDDIYVPNGVIYHQSKNNTSRDWEKLSGELPSGKIYDLAADKDNLYACALTFEDDDDGYNVPDVRSLWKYNGSTWTKLLEVDYSSSYFFVFGTNTLQKANRHAFLRYGSNVYELSDSISKNSTSTDGWTALTNKYKIALGASISDVKSATCLGRDVILSPYRASTSNETETEDADYVYTASGDVIYYLIDGTDWQFVDTDSEDILAMGFTQDYMLLGTDEGIQHVLISGKIPGASTQDFSNNADSALSSYYVVESLLVVDPSKTEAQTAIFASIEFDGSSSSTSAVLDNVGLWGYYEGKGEWNRQ